MDWLNLPHLLILPPVVSAKQRIVIIPGDQPSLTDSCWFSIGKMLCNWQPAEYPEICGRLTV